MHLATADHEFDLHFFAQFDAHQRRIFLEFFEGARRKFFERGAPFVLFKVKRGATGAQRLPALALAQVTTGDLRQTGNRVNQLKHARAAFSLAETGDHFLNDQPQTGIGGRAFGLSQQARRRAIPRPRHRSQHGGKLFARILRETFVGFLLIGLQHREKTVGPVIRNFIEHIRVKPRHIDRVGLNEP